MNPPKYIAVTTCRNEEKTIGHCVHSVLNQSYPPSCYIVVDDGSIDKTPIILKKYEPRLCVVSLKKAHCFQRGGHLLRLLLFGLKKAAHEIPDWEFLLTVDADEVLFEDYVQKLILKMIENNRLGITSGIPYSRVKGGYLKIQKASFNVWNGARLYRRQCFDQIHKIPIIQGWDMWIQFEANRLGWVTIPFDDINFKEERPWGNPGWFGIGFWIRRGFIRQLLGFSLISQVLSSAKRVNEKPYIIGSMAFLFAYISYRLCSMRPFSSVYYCFVRQHTIKMVRESIKRMLK